MCGILFSLRYQDGNQVESDEQLEQWEILKEANALRGPDSRRAQEISIQTLDNECAAVKFFSSVLHLRGTSVFAQPVVSLKSGNILCWNGQIFEGMDIGMDENDTQKLFECLEESSSSAEGVLDVFSRVEGPYAFVFYHAGSQTLYFGRDPLGRRSLLISSAADGRSFTLASVSAGRSEYEWKELDCGTVGIIDLKSNQRQVEWRLRDGPGPFTRISPINPTIPETVAEISSSLQLPIIPEPVVEEFITALSLAVKLRVENIPPRLTPHTARLAILFSGGIDCTVVALLADSYIPLTEPIDLLNVAFENPRAIEAKLTHAKQTASSKRGKKVLDQEDDEGGGGGIYDVPDRMTGLEALRELRLLRPNRTWNFVLVDIPYEESQSHIAQITNLMVPQDTIMDLSLSLALFFASRGTGTLYKDDSHSAESLLKDDTSPLFQSDAKVLLSGLGADEQLGGYARHRRAYETKGWQGVVDEVQMDLDRIPSRNLGRDDRVISSHGLETRFPYLSLSFIAHLSSVPVHLKCDLRYPEAIGDKSLLRAAARKLGLVDASSRKKRAMQFGSRSAKMEKIKGGVKGHEKMK